MGYSLIRSGEINEVPKFTYLWQAINEQQKKYISSYLTESKSQYVQDLFIISEIALRKLPPFFVEFGATDGITLSNTYLLEKNFNWTGILAEPAKVWEKSLKENRNCFIDTRCVYSKTGEKIEFSETLSSNSEFKVSSPELSTIKNYADNKDWASDIRKNNSITYSVETVSLNDLLQSNNAPYNIGYLSIDTEGSEFMILSSFDFSKHRIEIISVEHNHNIENRKKINILLSQNGYFLKYESIFGPDDIYILR
ncbi:MAG: hypothetical protein RL387_1709, partial [Bacteroidota bacterium]|jgi:FkbM family methyltransferase